MISSLVVLGILSVQEVKLLAEPSSKGADFGYDVAIQGGRALIGAYAAGQPSYGAAYVFDDGWKQTELVQPELPGPLRHSFGVGTALAGDVGYVGASGDDKFPGVSGIVYEYTRDPKGVWGVTATFEGAEVNDKFGYSVDASRSTPPGESVLIVGSPQADSMGKVDAGSATIFVQEGGVWQPGFTVIAAQPAPGVHLGYGVAVSPDGHIAVASTFHPLVNQASYALVYERGEGNTWVAVNEVTVGGQGIGFGHDIAVANDGTLVVTAFYGDMDPIMGAVYVCKDVHLEKAYSCEVLPVPDDVSANFGGAVAIDEDVIVIGCANEFSKASGEAEKTGAFYLALREDGVWSVREEEFGPSDGGFYDLYGARVAISGSSVVIGAYGHDHGEVENTGAAYVYTFGRAGDSCDNDIACASGCCTDEGFCGGLKDCSGETTGGEMTGGESTTGGSDGGTGGSGTGGATTTSSTGADSTSGTATGGGSTSGTNTAEGATDTATTGGGVPYPDPCNCRAARPVGADGLGLGLGLGLLVLWRRRGRHA